MAKITKKTTAKAVETKKVAAKKPVVEKVKKTAEVKSEPVFKIAKYLNKNVMISPRKLRLLANDIKKLKPTEALLKLRFTNTKAARIMTRAVQNVISDAKNNFGLDADTLKFDTIQVNEGLKIKRMDKSHGARFARGLMMKRHSRLTIFVKGIQK